MIIIRNQRELESYIIRHLDTIHPDTITKAFEALTRWEAMTPEQQANASAYLELDCPHTAARIINQ